MIYVAAPYTHDLRSVREARAYCISKLAGELMRRNQHDWIFSPITQGHEAAKYLPMEVASNHAFWMRQCKQALAEAACLYLLPLPGWENSKGLMEELEYCQHKSLPVYYLDCRTWAKLHLRMSGDDSRTVAERHARSIWQWLAAQPRVVDVPAWRRNWRVRELLEMPVVGEGMGRMRLTYVATDAGEAEEQEVEHEV